MLKFKLFPLLIIVFISLLAQAQVFIPMAFWRPKKQLTMSCKSGCYPTPGVEFTAALYYVVRNSSVNFRAISVSNPSAHDFCFGPTTAGGCSATPIPLGLYPLVCPGPGNGTMDGSASATGDEASYTSPNAVVTDTCYVTDYNENQVEASANISVFTGVNITSPTTSVGSPRNICVSQTLGLGGSGGLGTLNWSVSVGSGTVSPLTGTTTTYTAPATAQSVQVSLTDSTTSMTAIGYFNITSTIAISPISTVETPVNSATMQDPTTSAGTPFVANLNFSARCGLANYTVSCTGGGSVSPTSSVANNANVRFRPASATGTSIITFTDSTTPTAQTASQTVYNIVPVDIAASWGYHVCVKYSHSTYAAGTYKLKCWGYNANGQLGYGDTNARGDAAAELGVGLTFVKNTGTTGSDMMVKDVSVGLSHTCAILSDNTVKCWGLNTFGQLGYDNTTQLTSPIAATVNIGAGTPSKLYASGDKTCLVFSDNRLKCWGRNSYGELGQDSTTNYGSNNTTASMAGLGYISVAGSQLTVLRLAGSENNICVLTTAAFVPGPQKVYCWGLGNANGNNCSNTANRYCGEMANGLNDDQNWGDGTNLMSALPVVNLGTTGSETLIDIAAGKKHICAIIAPNAVSTSGVPICWGYNSSGQAGIDNNPTDIGRTELPTVRAAVTTVKRLEMFARSSCGIKTDDTVRCWGRGAEGQLLGSNNTGTGGGGYNVNVGDDGAPLVSALVPSNFGTGLTIKKLGLGYYFGCAILNNDYIKCWGAQYCGIGTTTTNNGCLLSGVSNVLDNNAGAPTLMDSRYYGDSSTEVGDAVPYLNH